MSFRLREVVEPTDRMRFRFVAEEERSANVEVGIDDLELLDFAASCGGPVEPEPEPEPGGPEEGDGGGGGCRSGPGSAAAALALLLLLRRRRR